jgi:hypothetical protein
MAANTTNWTSKAKICAGVAITSEGQGSSSGES